MPWRKSRVAMERGCDDDRRRRARRARRPRRPAAAEPGGDRERDSVARSAIHRRPVDSRPRAMPVAWALTQRSQGKPGRRRAAAPWVSLGTRRHRWKALSRCRRLSRRHQLVSRARPHSSSSVFSSSAPPGDSGVEITYFPDAQFPRSIVRHRSLQNGNSGSPGATSFLHAGHFITARPAARYAPAPAVPAPARPRWAPAACPTHRNRALR